MFMQNICNSLFDSISTWIYYWMVNLELRKEGV